MITKDTGTFTGFCANGHKFFMPGSIADGTKNGERQGDTSPCTTCGAAVVWVDDVEAAKAVYQMFK